MSEGKEGPDKKFSDFTHTIERRVNDIGVRKGSTLHRAFEVNGRLYKISGGDALKVTDAMIEAEYDTLHGEPGDEAARDRVPRDE